MIPLLNHRMMSSATNGKNYILPLEFTDLSDEELVQTVLKWLYEIDMKTCDIQKVTNLDKDDDEKVNPSNNIQVECLYSRGDSEYPFELHFELVRLYHPKPISGVPLQNRQPILSNLRVVQEEHELFDELIHARVLPDFKESSGMKTYRDYYRLILPELYGGY